MHADTSTRDDTYERRPKTCSIGTPPVHRSIDHTGVILYYARREIQLLLEHSYHPSLSNWTARLLLLAFHTYLFMALTD
jgi:hypothetical protein